MHSQTRKMAAASSAQASASVYQWEKTSASSCFPKFCNRFVNRKPPLPAKVHGVAEEIRTRIHSPSSPAASRFHILRQYAARFHSRSAAVRRKSLCNRSTRRALGRGRTGSASALLCRLQIGSADRHIPGNWHVGGARHPQACCASLRRCRCCSSCLPYRIRFRRSCSSA